MTTLTNNSLPFGLKKFMVFEPETHWNKIITAKSEGQARDKAWEQFWSKLPFSHCNKNSFQVREV